MKTIISTLIILIAVGCKNPSEKQDSALHEFNKSDIKANVTNALHYLRGVSNNENAHVGIGCIDQLELPFIASATHALYSPKIDETYEGMYFENTNENWVIVILNPNSPTPDKIGHLEKIADYVYKGTYK